MPSYEELVARVEALERRDLDIQLGDLPLGKLASNLQDRFEFFRAGQVLPPGAIDPELLADVSRGLFKHGYAAGPTYAGTSFTGNTAVTVTLETSGHPVLVLYSGSAEHNGVDGTAYTGFFAVRMDGVTDPDHNIGRFQATRNGDRAGIAGVRMFTPLKGEHSFTMHGYDATAFPAVGIHHSHLVVIELPLIAAP